MRKPCQATNCERVSNKNGRYCPGHAARVRRYGSPQAHIPLNGYRVVKTCTIGDCKRPHVAKGMCAGHYHRAKYVPRARQVAEGQQKLKLWFPAGPLLEAVEVEATRRRANQQGGVVNLRRQLGLNGLIRPDSRLRWTTVDRVCVALKRHPIEVYGLEWVDAA